MLEKPKTKLQELKQEQQEIKKEVSLAQVEIEKLEEYDLVRKYIELSTRLKELKNKLPQLELDIFRNEKFACEHIWITSTIEKEFDGHRTDRFEYISCIRCGLNEYDNKLYYHGFRDDKCTITHEIFQKPRKGIKTNIVCDHDLAKGIYEGIIRNYPNISDEEIVKYFMAALHKIRTRKASPTVVEKRIERLSLKPNFENWRKL